MINGKNKDRRFRMPDKGDGADENQKVTGISGGMEDALQESRNGLIGTRPI
jgi:hypothetical protein